LAAHKLPEEKRQRILELLTEGKSLRSACLETGVHLQTVMGWNRTDEAWHQAYLEAKQEGADSLAEKITDLAQEALDSPEKANAIRVAMDAYKWVASKLKPKSYGDRIEQHVVNETQSPAEVEARIKLLEAELADMLKAKQDSQEKAEQEGQNGLVEQAQTAQTHSTTPTPPLH
jgi:transposase-like protein